MYKRKTNENSKYNKNIMYKKDKINNFLDNIFELINKIKFNKNDYLSEMINLNTIFLDQNSYIEIFFKLFLDIIEKKKNDLYYKLEKSKDSCKNIYDKLVNKWTNFIKDLDVINNDINNNYDEIVNEMEIKPFDNILDNYYSKINFYEKEMNILQKQPNIITEKIICTKNNKDDKNFINSIKISLNNYLTTDFNNSNIENKYLNKLVQTQPFNNHMFTQTSQNVWNPKLNLKNKNTFNNFLRKNDGNNKSYYMFKENFQAKNEYKTSEKNKISKKDLLNFNLDQQNEFNTKTMFKKKSKKQLFSNDSININFKESTKKIINFNKKNKYNKVIINYKNIINKEKDEKSKNKSFLYQEILDNKFKNKSYSNLKWKNNLK